MAEYLDKEAFKKSVEERYCKPCKAEKKDHNGCWCRACWVDDMLDEVECFQPADVAPVRHGRWVGDSFCKWQCNKCHAPAPKYGYPVSEFVRSSYCPNCGTDMRGSNDE